MADDFFGCYSGTPPPVQDVLNFPGLLHRERPANERKENAAEEKNDHGKNDVIRNDLFGWHIGLSKPAVDSRAECMLQRGHHWPEYPIHLFGNQKTMLSHTTPLAAF
jgi:hypothetical protein